MNREDYVEVYNDWIQKHSEWHTTNLDIFIAGVEYGKKLCCPPRQVLNPLGWSNDEDTND